MEYCKVGDDKCPDRTADDPEIVKFAKDNNLIIVTKDIKMINECKFESVKYITINDIFDNLEDDLLDVGLVIGEKYTENPSYWDRKSQQYGV